MEVDGSEDHEILYKQLVETPFPCDVFVKVSSDRVRGAQVSSFWEGGAIELAIASGGFQRPDHQRSLWARGGDGGGLGRFG